jgi:hypothetical protein
MGTITAVAKPEIQNGVLLLAEREVQRRAGCDSVREGREVTFRILDERTEALLALRGVIEGTGAFEIQD